MSKIQVKRTIDLILELTADDWQLYDIPDRDFVAKKLNRGLELAVAVSGTRSEAETAFAPTMKKYSHWGASDSEGYHMMAHVLDKCYGEE